MTFEIALRRSLLLPHFAQKRDDKTSPPGRKIHWVGDKEPTRPGQGQNQGGKQKDNKPNQDEGRDTRGYRELSTITLGEVSEGAEVLCQSTTPQSVSRLDGDQPLLHAASGPPARMPACDIWTREDLLS